MDAPRSSRSVRQVDVRRRVAAPASTVWPVITDHALYGRLAPNLSRVEVAAGEGLGMTRRCYDAVGRGWTETCTLWDEGREYGVEVDTSDYPYPLEVMRGRWSVEPDGEGSIITMHFEFAPRPGPVGATFAAAMRLLFRPVVARIMRGWDRRLASHPSVAPGSTRSTRRATPAGEQDRRADSPPSPMTS